MVILKSNSGVETGGVTKEYTSPDVSHPAQTTGSVVYTINHNFGIDGGPDLILCYAKNDAGYEDFYQLRTLDRSGSFNYGQDWFPIDSKTQSKIAVFRVASATATLQFRCFKFTSTQNP